jgi:DNA-binding response OmpR family regulator
LAFIAVYVTKCGVAMPRVLILEPEPLIADFIERGLRDRHFATAVAGVLPEPEAAHEYDVVVLDEQLVGDEWQAIRECLAGHERQPILIVLSGHGRVSETMATLGDLSAHVLTKPFRFAELLAAIEGRLASRRRVD